MFPELKISKEWDRKRINVESKKKKDKYKRELDAIENFIKYFSEFKKDQFNKKLKLRLEDTKLLKDTIIIANFIDGFDKIK
ncbi:hypothetical protein [Halonatronum saccharophilum]|uniref:hypothetical protein n=1 Tax=Halonatronum saccharophilum TaxID=150060 RepID=UPI0004855E1E|nr:hypothetical protein [Halonatronum saccharophilum]